MRRGGARLIRAVARTHSLLRLRLGCQRSRCPHRKPRCQGHYWNNITANNGNYAKAGSVYKDLVYSDNTPSEVVITTNSRFTTNGMSGGGGYLTPEADKLGDLAVKNATSDYFFIEKSENNSNFTISGLPLDRCYKFYIFASRKAEDNRTGRYTMAGVNTVKGELQAAGKGIGHDGSDQNTQNILVSDYVFPDEDGTITFTVSRVSGNYIPLNVLKIEEFSGMERPADRTIVSATLAGSAVTEAAPVVMHNVSPDGKNHGIFEAFTMLGEGSLSFTATLADDSQVAYGVNGTTLVANSTDSYAIDEPVLAMIKADFSAGTLQVVPVTAVSMTGSAVHGWSTSNVEDLDYIGDGVWQKEVTLTNRPSVSDRSRFNFILNHGWTYTISHIKDTPDAVALTSDGYSTADINLNFGSYIITLDLRAFTYNIAPANGIDPYRISVMGSSVSNGQGATDNHGYAYMFDQLISTRHNDNLSEHPFYISSIAVNGNNTVNLLDRYSELTNEFGKYVIYGVSLGNEGIHGAADQQAVYNQFANNMQLLISKAREEGKEVVVMNNYTRGDFTPADYEFVKKMNLLINSWDLPSVNLLGAIDNGVGIWADGYQNNDDIYHPNTDGHSELFYAITPSLFDALHAGKPLPERVAGTGFLMNDKGIVEFEPENTVHPFALVVSLNGAVEGEFVTIATADGNATIAIEGTTVTYTAPNGNVITGTLPAAATPAARAAANATTLTLSHYHAQGRTLLYAGNTLIGETAGKLAPTKVSVKPQSGKLNLSELMFYRSALNADEVAAINNGDMIKSSLDVYLPFAEGTLPETNHAQSMVAVKADSGISSGISSVSIEDDAAPFQAKGYEGFARVIAATPLPITIHTLDGRLLTTLPAAATTAATAVDAAAANAAPAATTIDIPLPAGLYLINNLKVLVK